MGLLFKFGGHLCESAMACVSKMLVGCFAMPDFDKMEKGESEAWKNTWRSNLEVDLFTNRAHHGNRGLSTFSKSKC